MNHTYLLLGSNEGDRVQWLQFAISELEKTAGTLMKRSGIYETAAWGLTDQPDFLNQVICLATTLDAETLLNTIQRIEQAAGRQRNLKWGQRSLDIDILFFNDFIIQTPDLRVPHPFLQERRFTLTPLAEIAPDLVHPVLQETIASLLAQCKDMLPAHLVEPS